MTEQMLASEKLSETLKNMQKCLECPICLNIISIPVKTTCGHWFCRDCIKKVTRKKKGSCPLCKAVLRQRNVSRDDLPNLYTEKLENLINAIRADTGIDILSHSRQPRDSKESRSTDENRYNKSETEQNFRNEKQGSSFSEGQPCLQPNRNARSRRRTSKSKENSTNEDNENRDLNSTANDNSNSLWKYGFSGIESLPSYDRSCRRNVQVAKDKVETWLQALPDSKGIDVSETITAIETSDGNLNSTVIDTLPEINADIEVNKCNRYCEGNSEILHFAKGDNDGRQTENSLRSHSSENLSRSTNNATGRNKRKRTRRSLATKNVDGKTEDLKLEETRTTMCANNQEDQRPSTSNTVTSNHNGNDDVLKTPSTNMLPSAKQNWSSVVRFGKEMKTKKKKLKSLNISVESGRKSRQSNESVEEGIIRTRLIKDARHQNTSNRKRNDSNVSESIVTFLVDNCRHEEKQQLANIKNNHTEEGTTAHTSKEKISCKNRSNESREEENHLPARTSFITLKAGKQVRIKNLNSYQMNDIIGVASGDESHKALENETVSPSRHSKSDALLLTNRDNIFITPPNLSMYSPQITPVKGDSLLLQEKMEIPGISSSSRFQSPVLTETPSHGRLSLRKKQETRKHDSCKPTTFNNSSRLLSAKRDLNQLISLDREPTTGDVNVAVLPSEVEGRIQEKPGQESNRCNRPPSILTNCTNVSDVDQNRKAEHEKLKTGVVVFKKLGSTFKQRKNAVKFLYLGSTRRVRLTNLRESNSLINIQKPSNPIVQLDAIDEPSTSKTNCNQNTQIVNDTAMSMCHETENNSSLSHSKCATRDKSLLQNENMSLRTKNVPTESFQRGSEFNERTTTKRIDLFKNKTPKNSTSTTDIVTNRSPESTGVLLVSLYDNAENEGCCKKRSQQKRCFNKVSDDAKKSPVRQKPKTAEIKMLPPEEDSQLKFFSVHSPLPGNIETTESIQQVETTENTTTNKSNYFHEKGTHSRALIQKSREGNVENLRTDSSWSPSRKRKRSHTRDKLTHKIKRTLRNRSNDPMQDNESDSGTSFSSKITQIRKGDACSTETAKSCKAESSGRDTSKKRYPGTSLDSRNLQDDKAVAQDRNNDITEKENNACNESRKLYKRITQLSDSDTDSTEVIMVNDREMDTNERVKQTSVISTNSEVSKRKRAELLSTDSNFNAILNKWYEEGRSSKMCTKRGRLERVADSINTKTVSRGEKWDALLQSNNLRDTSSATNIFDFVSMNTQNKSNRGNRWEHRETRGNVSNEDSPDFNSIIDKVREIQRIEINFSFNSSDKAIKHQGNTNELNLMQDNFDDIIANVDTDALMYDPMCSEGTSGSDARTRKYDSIRCLVPKGSKVSCNKMKSFTSNYQLKDQDIFTPSNSNNSNKENSMEYQKASKTVRFNDSSEKEDDDEVTLTPEHINVIEKHLAKENAFKYNRSLRNIRSYRPSNSKVLSTGDNVPRENVSRRILQDVDKCMTHREAPNDCDSLSKETSYEFDSLMNITQHQLLIKQFEEDLFGKTSTSSWDRKSIDEPQTPRNLPRKDVEYSGGEDDIVENTPDTKTKHEVSIVQWINSMGRKGSTTSQETVFTISSPLTEISAGSVHTPIWKKSMYPLFQSTPKMQQIVPKGSSVDTRAYRENKSKRVSNTSILLGKQVRDDAVANMQQEPERRKLCFVCSGLVPAQINCVKELADICNAKYVTQFEEEVTHVIVEANGENNAANKTLKYLQGVAHRKWVVAYKWVIDSLKGMKLVPEEPYEAVDSSTLEAGPRNSRLREKDLFEGFVVLCIGPYVDVSVEQYKDLLVSTGAAIVESLEDLAAERKKLKAIVIQADTYDCHAIVGWYQKARAVPITHEWIVQCISQYKLMSFYPYLQELLRQDVLALGFPEFLVEEDHDEDSNGTCETPT